MSTGESISDFALPLDVFDEVGINVGSGIEEDDFNEGHDKGVGADVDDDDDDVDFIE